MSPKQVLTQRNPVTERDSWELLRSFHEAAKGEPYEIERPGRIPPLQKWFRDLKVPKSRGLRHEQWIAERLRFAVIMLRESVTLDPEIRGGVPVLKGTRVPIAQLLAEIADDASVSEIADDLDLDVGLIVKLLEGIAIHLDRPFFR